MNRCVIFDLDGTLIDSRADIANAVNATRRDFHLPPLSQQTVVSYVGDGVRKLIFRAFLLHSNRFACKFPVPERAVSAKRLRAERQNHF